MNDKKKQAEGDELARKLQKLLRPKRDKLKRKKNGKQPV